MSLCLALTLTILGPLLPPSSNFGDPNGPVAIARANQRLFRSAAQAVAPFVVRIETVGGTQPTQEQRQSPPGSDSNSNTPDDRPFRDDLGAGFQVADGPTTGIIHSEDGFILTSSFNFVRDPVLISVILHDGRRFVATLVGRDRVRKLALLKIDAQGLSLPEWVDRSELSVGQWTIAVGRVLSLHEPTITVGIVSALDRMVGFAIQTDANLSPANYGGPLVDDTGRVVGICVPMAQRPGELAGVELYDAGIGFVVPRDHIDRIVPQLKQGHSFYRGWLGLLIDPHNQQQVEIQAIADPSPMAEAGMQAGDIITQINGNSISHFGHLVQALYMLPAGTEVQLDIQRQDEEISVVVRLARAEQLGPLPTNKPPFDPTQPQSDQGGAQP